MVDKKTVEYVAHLGRLEVDGNEKERLAQELSKIMGYIDKLKCLNVEGVEPMRGALTGKNVLRSDEVGDKYYSRDILESAPAQENNQFKIPRVIR